MRHNVPRPPDALARSEVGDWPVAAAVASGEIIYDLVWFPLGGAGCFATTSRDHPIALWNAVDGSVRERRPGRRLIG